MEKLTCVRNSFLAIADELQLRGLMGNLSSDDAIHTKPETPFQNKESRFQNHRSKISKLPSLRINESNDNILDVDGGNRSVPLTSYFSGNVQELNEKCISMMENTFKKDKNGNLLYSCTICGKEAINALLKNHIEANHLEVISIFCNFCETTLKTRQALRAHMSRNHKKTPLH